MSLGVLGMLDVLGMLGVLAHQGGWDEALLVAAPLLLFATLVWNAKRRATRQTQGVTGDTGATSGTGTGSGKPAGS